MPPKLKDAIGWMFDYIEPGKTLLDFGCSTGYFGQYIRKSKQCKVYGVEISDDRFEAEKVLNGVYSFDLDVDWPDTVYERKYDYLFFGDVIEHLKDPQKVLEKCKKLLKPGGLIFISTPNIAHISIRLELMCGNFDYEPMGILDNTHLKYFTKKSLSGLVKSAGYTIELATFSANDYPDAAIKKLLNKAGLTPTAAFWNMVNQPEARAFQHKFIISPGKHTPLKQTVEPESQKPEFLRNAEYNDLRNKVKNLENHAKKQAEIIEHYAAENEKLRKGSLQRAKRVLRTTLNHATKRK